MTFTCRAYVENVVKPPSTPTPRKTRRSGSCPHSEPSSTPISRQPRTLTTKVAHGQVLGSPGQASATPQRASDPSAPPKAHAPTRVGRRTSLTRRSVGEDGSLILVECR